MVAFGIYQRHDSGALFIWATFTQSSVTSLSSLSVFSVLCSFLFLPHHDFCNKIPDKNNFKKDAGINFGSQSEDLVHHGREGMAVRAILAVLW